MMVARFITKKSLRESIGRNSRSLFVETSIFGPEYPASGTGTITVVGPDAYDRRWYATVTLKNHVIVKVA
jgi:hypothetical protein